MANRFQETESRKKDMKVHMLPQASLLMECGMEIFVVGHQEGNYNPKVCSYLLGFKHLLVLSFDEELIIIRKTFSE